MKNTKAKHDARTTRSVVLLHFGDREKSGIQIHAKLNQYNIPVIEKDVLDESFELELTKEQVLSIVANIGKVNFDFDSILSKLFEDEFKVIINEASRSNELTGLQRRSWERHLLNKIDSNFSVFPNSEKYIKSSNLDLSAFGIKKTWVLAASIGGPEALKEFFSEFKLDQGVLFIVIQHMDKEFVNNFKNQLQEVTELNVQLPISGQLIESGIIIYPTDEKLSFDNEGHIELHAMNESFKYTPCIDSAVKQLLDNIINADIAVFSGMCTDGVDAAQMVKNNKGKVVLQSQDSCVISTIVDGVKNKLKCDFEGDPKQIAHYIQNHMERNHVQ